MSKRAAEILIGEQADGHSTTHSPAKNPRDDQQSTTWRSETASATSDKPHVRSSIVRDNDERAPARLPIQRSDDFGIASAFLINIMRPTRVHPRVYRVLQRNELDIYSSTLYQSLLRALYPDGAFNDRYVITMANFQSVVQYILHARVHYIYGNATGRRVEGRIPFTRNMLMPTALARIINQYGQVVVYDGMIEVSFTLNSFFLIHSPRSLGRSTTLAE